MFKFKNFYIRINTFLSGYFLSEWIELRFLKHLWTTLDILYLTLCILPI